jgi:hypothetical protein
MGENLMKPVMAGVPAEEQAKRAIAHVLGQIRDNPHVGWYLGYGTQSFTLLTEAAATLWGKPLEEVRRAFLPRDPKDPSQG